MKVIARSETQFPGYVFFDDPRWAEGFSVHPTFAATIANLRQGIALLQAQSSGDTAEYLQLVRRVNDVSYYTRGKLPYWKPKNAALVEAVVDLLQQAANAVIPTDRTVVQLQQRMRLETDKFYRSFCALKVKI